MNSVKILIVEDEPIIADDLVFILDEMGYTETVTVHTGEDAISTIKEENIDLVLLDINLASKVDGVHVAEYICENNSIPFVFLTSLSDDVTIGRVKKTRPAAYMVKPFDEKTLRVNIELALSNHIKEDKKNIYSDTYYVKDKVRMTKVAVKDILYLEGSSNYTLIYCTNQKFVVSQTLKKVQAQLDPEIFMRIHKSNIVNLDKIEYIEDAHVIIAGKKLAISRTYREIFQSRLNTI